MYLNSNQLSGTIPSQIGNLGNLYYLILEYNQLSGTIPSEIGNLANLQYLLLNGNQLTGTIPAWTGNSLTNLWYLDLSSNDLVGDIPSSIVNLSGLGYGCVDYNGLSSSDPAVQTFMEAEFPDWQNTQTVPPTNVTVSALGSGSATLSWTPVLYTSDPGYYEVGISQTSGGPYTFSTQNQTGSKSASQLTVTGLSPGANYLVVQTVTPANSNNQNTVTSLPSTEVQAVVKGVSKSSSDGSSVEADGVVTAAFSGCFYVENQDRSCGICIIDSAAAPTSGMVDVTGTLHTNATTGERYIQASGATSLGSGIVNPLGLSNKSLGGGDSLYNSTTGAGQCGIWGANGLNNIGLFVRIWGNVTANGTGWFYLDDGSGVSDGSVNSGIYVNAEGQTVPDVGKYACVTGISSCRKYQNNVVNTLLATSVSSAD